MSPAASSPERADSGDPLEARLRAAQARLEGEAVGPLLSLDPGRERATPLVELHRGALAELHGDALAARLAPGLASGLAALALAQLEAFPGNLFWDLDLIAFELLRQAREAHATRSEDPVALLDDRFARMVRLQQLYGRETAINFSYVHDFVYGFDWAKWVGREPEVQRDPPGPFELEFLIYMERRGKELLELIAEDDAKYPNLDDDEARNPFPFSREPKDEIRLHAELARRDLIPAPTWDRGAVGLDWRARWRTDFQARRVEVAEELGLLLTE